MRRNCSPQYARQVTTGHVYVKLLNLWTKKKDLARNKM